MKERVTDVTDLDASSHQTVLQVKECAAVFANLRRVPKQRLCWGCTEGDSELLPNARPLDEARPAEADLLLARPSGMYLLALQANLNPALAAHMVLSTSSQSHQHVEAIYCF